MDKEESLIDYKKDKSIRRVIHGIVDYFKSKVDKNYILSDNSPKFLKTNRKLILKTIRMDSSYLNQVPDDILLEELLSPQLPIDGIIYSAFKKGYMLCKSSPKILMSEKAKNAILQYIKMQKKDENNMFREVGVSCSRKISRLVEDLDESLFSDVGFREELLTLAIEKGYKIKQNSPGHLLRNERLAENYYKDLLEINAEDVISQNILSPELLSSKDFLRNYISLLSQNGISKEIIIDTLTHNEDCINVFKNNIELFQYIFDSITPSKLDDFFSKFFSEDESEVFLLNSEKLQGRLLRLSQLYNKDKTVLQSLNGELLDEKYNGIDNHKMQIIARNPEFQNRILGLNDYQLSVYNKMTQLVAKKTDRWNRFDQNIIINLSDGYYGELINDLYEQAKDGNKIDSKDIEVLTFLLSKKSSSKSEFNIYSNRAGMDEKALEELIYYNNNIFNITKKSELEHFEEIKELVCDTVLINPSLDDEELTSMVDKYLGKFRALPELDRMKLALLEKYYNMDLSEAEIIVKKFSTDIDNIQSKDEYQYSIIEQIRAIKNIFESNDINILKQIGDLDLIVQTDLATSTYLIEEAIEMYEQQYKDILYIPKEDEKIGDTIYNGINIEVYDSNIDFSMVVKRVGASEKNYKEIWDSMTKDGEYARKDLRYYTSTSYMTDENLLHEDSDTQIILGFGQGVKDYSFDGVYPGDAHTPFFGGDDIYINLNNSSYMTPSTLEVNTDNEYNEIVINTLGVNENGQMTKMQPDYIVYIKNKSDIGIDELESDPVWVNSKKAASEFGIPIVVVDKEKIRESEKTKIASMSEEVRSTSSSSEILKFVKKVEHYISRYGIESISEIKFVSKDKINFLKEQIEKKQKKEQKDILIPNTITNTTVKQSSYNRQSVLERQSEMKKANIIHGVDER